ncbi:MAG: NAD-dependent epimerase/dehydratase family protein [Sulfuricellaceae bacterium]|nr:NAD-dependent epimerase/dehydratase family protein [Sulfuricellaceae bacterium]
MKIFLTGSAGHLASVLLPALCADEGVASVTGVDLRPSAYRHPKFCAYRLDYGREQAHGLIAGHDALIHLGFRVLRGRMSARAMWRNNVESSQALFEAAQRRDVRRMLHVSSAAVYGNGENLPESARLSPIPDFQYGNHKAILEEWLAQHHPRVVCLRPHVILGRHAQPLLRFLLRQPCYLQLPDPQPQLQCIDERDVVEAIRLCLNKDVRGAFNLAGPESFSFQTLICSRYSGAVGIAPWLGRIVLQSAWRLGGVGGEPGWMGGLERSLTLDCSRAHEELGWRPQHDLADSLTMTLAGL